MGFPGVISYNPTCRGPITPFITGVWAHLGLLITIPSSKMPSFSLPLLSGIAPWVRTSTWTPRKRLAPTRRCQKCLVHGGCFCWCEGNSSYRGVRSTEIQGSMGIQEGISSDRKEPEHIMETLMLGGSLSDLQIPSKSSKSSKISKKPHLGKEFVAMVEVEMLGLVLWCVFFM